MKYNTMFDVSFSVEHCEDDPYDVDVWDLIVALEKRVAYLKQNIKEAKDAFGICDTYEIEEVSY